VVGTRDALAIGGLTLIAAVLRFTTLDRQSFWSDEAVTVLLTRMELGDMVRTIAETESTPPVYYVVAWAWAYVLGDGEVGLRSLSALAGTALVPVAYVAGRVLVHRRVGIATAAVVAVSPVLVWYSQEARSYSLAVLLCAISFAAFARSLQQPTTAALLTWAVASGLAMATHYFAVFVVGAEVAWLLVARRSPAVIRAVGGVAVVGVALLPLALTQRSQGFAEFVGAADPLAPRVAIVAKQLLVGPDARAGRALAAGAAILLAVSIALLVTRRGARCRRAVAAAAVVAGAGIGLPFALAAIGADYANTRNLLMGFVPLTIVLVAGLVVAAPPRIGVAGLGVVIGVLSAASLVITLDPATGRPNWRGLAEEMRARTSPTALVVTPDHQGWFARLALEIYVPEARPVDGGHVHTPPAFSRLSRHTNDESPPGIRVREVVLAAVGWSLPELGDELPETLTRIEDRAGDGYRLVRYRSARRVSLETRDLVTSQSVLLLLD
jgi:mannosyltransferase